MNWCSKSKEVVTLVDLLIQGPRVPFTLRDFLPPDLFLSLENQKQKEELSESKDDISPCNCLSPVELKEELDQDDGNYGLRTGYRDGLSSSESSGELSHDSTRRRSLFSFSAFDLSLTPHRQRVTTAHRNPQICQPTKMMTMNCLMMMILGDRLKA